MKKENFKKLLSFKKQAISKLNKEKTKGGTATVTSFPNTACKICKWH